MHTPESDDRQEGYQRGIREAIGVAKCLQSALHTAPYVGPFEKAQIEILESLIHKLRNFERPA